MNKYFTRKLSFLHNFKKRMVIFLLFCHLFIVTKRVASSKKVANLSVNYFAFNRIITSNYNHAILNDLRLTNICDFTEQR